MFSFVSSALPVPVSRHAEVITLPPADSWQFWLPRWIARKAPSSQKVYADEMKAFLAFVQWRPIAALTTLDIESYQQSLVNAGNKPNTVARKIATVCSLVSFIYKRDSRLMPVNIGAAVERVKPSNELAGRILSEQEVLRMFDRETNPRNLALLRTLYSAGCRISEALGLKWGNIVWKDNGQALITVLGKGAKVRTVVIYGAAVEALRAIRPAGEGDASGHVFKTSHGPLKRLYAVQIVNAAARRAGIDKAVSCHWMRHASATHALERGAPLPLVSRTLGHSNLATTGRYLHVRPNESMGKFLTV